MYLVTSEQMRAMDRFTIEQIGIPAVVLMENAGRAVAEEVVKQSAKNGAADKPWIVLVGKGNNGADGIVAARHLADLGVKAELLYTVEPDTLQGETAWQRDIANRLGIASTSYTQGIVHWQRYSGIVDALLGTGTHGSPREPYAALIRESNDSGLPIVAIDIPSGLNADTGEVYEPCIRAKATVALAFMKIGLVQYPGQEVAGDILVKPIGIPVTLAERFQISTMLADRATLCDRFGLDLPLVRSQNTHKGTFGHVLVVAGSGKFSGAGLLASKATLRTGAGLVTWALPDGIAKPMIGHLPEAILVGVTDDGSGNWSGTSTDEILKIAEGKDVIAIGCGLNRFDGDTDWLRQIWTEAQCPLVADADALNIIADAHGLDSWPKRAMPTVLTPHPGEMARLARISVREVQRDRVGLAREFARKHGVTLVLKGVRTVIATSDGEVFVNTTGNPGMATGGSGDVLTGVIAGLAAQGLSPETAAVIGVFLHGEAGDRAAALRPSPASLISGDIVEAL